MGNPNGIHQDIDAWLVLNASGLTPLRQNQLLEAFGTAEQVLGASDEKLAAVEGITAAHISKLRTAQQEADLPGWREQCTELELTIITINDDNYPPMLKEIDDPPPLLFVQGDITKSDDLAIAIVGTRKCTPYGRKVARRLAGHLAQRGPRGSSGSGRTQYRGFGLWAGYHLSPGSQIPAEAAGPVRCCAYRVCLRYAPDARALSRS